MKTFLNQKRWIEFVLCHSVNATVIVTVIVADIVAVIVAVIQVAFLFSISGNAVAVAMLFMLLKLQFMSLLLEVIMRI